MTSFTTVSSSALALVLMSATAANLVGGDTVIATQSSPAITNGQSAAVPAASSTPSTNYKIDDVHSMAMFGVRHLGAGRFWGMFNNISGTANYQAGATLELDVTIDTNSVDSNNPKLDGHLKSPDFFNVVEFPTMTFKSVSSKALADDQFEVTGDLTIRGVTKRVTVKMQALGEADGPMGKRAGFEAMFTIKRTDFGVSYGADNGAVSDETRVVVALEGVSS
ncbi:MAG: YceI family protein [Phycisphaerales bacterium]|nr:YceI family protein [Phycisphaerales bacterium]